MMYKSRSTKSMIYNIYVYIYICKGMIRESPMVLLKDPNSCGVGALTATIV